MAKWLFQHIEIHTYSLYLYIWGFLGGTHGKESASAGDVRDMSWSQGWEDPLEEGMATHSSIVAWRVPWTEEPGGLQSMGPKRVGHDWSGLACTYPYIYYLVKYFVSSMHFFPVEIQDDCSENWELKGKVITKGWRSWNHFSWNPPSVGKFKYIMLLLLTVLP